MRTVQLRRHLANGECTTGINPFRSGKAKARPHANFKELYTLVLGKQNLAHVKHVMSESGSTARADAPEDFKPGAAEYSMLVVAKSMYTAVLVCRGFATKPRKRSYTQQQLQL